MVWLVRMLVLSVGLFGEVGRNVADDSMRSA